MKRTLADTLIDLTEGVLQPGRAPGLRVTSLSLDVPAELALRLLDGQWQLLLDVPEWRWQTGLEPPRGRLRVVWETGGPP